MFFIFIVMFLLLAAFSPLGMGDRWNINTIKISFKWNLFFLRREDLLRVAPVLQLNPAIDGVFGGAYPFGIDPVRAFVLSLSLASLLIFSDWAVDLAY